MWVPFRHPLYITYLSATRGFSRIIRKPRCPTLQEGESTISRDVNTVMVLRSLRVMLLLSNPYKGDIMGAIASQITSLTIVYAIVYSDADQRKHQSSWSLAFLRGIHRGPVNSPHKLPVTRKMFPFDDVIMSRSLGADVCCSYFARFLNENICIEQTNRLAFGVTTEIMINNLVTYTSATV